MRFFIIKYRFLKLDKPKLILVPNKYCVIG